MGRDGRSWCSPWWLPRALVIAVLAAGLPAAGTALASPASPASPAAASTSFNLNVAVGGIRALGRTWSFDFGATKGSDIDIVVAGLSTFSKGVSEDHEWATSAAFAPTVARDFTVTSTGHATIKTGSALSPVLAAALTFTPVKATRQACVTGRDTVYSGKLTGTLSLRTGLRGVKVSRKFSGKAPGAIVEVDKSCVPPSQPPPPPCIGGVWIVSAIPLTTGSAGGIQTQAARPSSWLDSIIRQHVPTASKWLTRADQLFAAGSAPKLNTRAHTVTVAGTAAGPITGAAVISYGPTYKPPVLTCHLGRKKYSQRSVVYTGTRVAVSRPFHARTVLTGTLSVKTGRFATYTAVTLTAK